MLVVIEQTRYGIYFGIAFGIIIILSFFGLLIRYCLPRILSRGYFRRETKKRLEEISNRFRYKYNSSSVSASEEIIIAVFCFTSLVIFIYLTTRVTTFQNLPNAVLLYRQLFRSTWLVAVEIIFSWIFLFDYILHLYMSGNRLRYLWSFPSFVSLLAILPGLYSMKSGYYFYGFQHIRVIRTYQSLLFLQYYKKTQKLFDAEKGFIGQIVLLVFTLWALIISSAGFEFVVENQTINPNGLIHGFFNAFYFSIVTIATVGYGDIVPKTVFGKLVIIGVILIGIIIVPYRAGQLINVLRTARDPARKKFRGHPHIVVIVHDPTSILAFLHEFYHEDRQQTRIKTCFLVSQEKEVSAQVLRFIQTPPNNLRTDLLKGNPLVDFDLERTKMRNAKACFILVDKFAPSQQEEDASNSKYKKNQIEISQEIILETFAIRHYNEEIPIHVQTIRGQSVDILKGPNIHPFSVLELKLGVLVHSLLCPGFSTLFGTLVKAYKPPYSVCISRHHDWRSDLGNELYVSKPLRNFVGISFTDAVNFILEETEVLCIGILSHNDYNTQIILNPGINYIIKREDCAIVFAQDILIVDKIPLIDTDLLEIRSRVFVYSPSDFKNCRLKQTNPRKKSLESSIVNNASGILREHFVLVSNDFITTAKLINCLRKFNTYNSVLIVSESLPQNEEWESIIDSSNVYIIILSHTDPQFIEKAGIRDSKSVAILRESKNAYDPVVDASNIILFRSISQVQEATLIDLVHSSNSRYLGPRARSHSTTKNAMKNAYFAAGQVFVAISNLISVSNYTNLGLRELLFELLSGYIVSLSISKNFPQQIGSKYLEFIKDMQIRGYLPLALYRNCDEGRYLITNPFPTSTIRSDDFVLALESHVSH